MTHSHVIWILKTVFVKMTPFLLRMIQREAYFALTQAEQDVCQRLRRFATFGWADIWCQKEMVDSCKSNLC